LKDFILFNMTKIKICGFTNADTAKEAVLAGIDAIGLVFYEKSPRNVDINSAREIVASLPPFVNRVGLFVNANPSFIDEVLCEVPLDTLQFHGDEGVIDCTQYQMPFIKSVRVSLDTNVTQIADDFSQASGLLLDSYNSHKYGGTGEVFDWSLACVDIELPVILAGGLNSDNVAEAIKQVRPYAVDASSGVESEPGVKDVDKIRAFIRQIHS
jgi:phosphoribosylanthranilate isomerase